jgi:hypothetical protein
VHPTTKGVQKDHPLVGTWITDDEDSNLAITIEIKKGNFKVSSFVRSTGEFLKISKLLWDGKALSFSSLVPSNGWRTRVVFRAARDASAHVEFTDYEVWKKKDVKPGEIPEAWKI